MTQISNLFKPSIFATTFITSSLIVIQSAPASAVSLTIPTTTVDANTNVFSGPSFTVTSDFLSTDTISLNVAGTVNMARFDSSDGYTVNAAGITTKIGTIGGKTIPLGSFDSSFLVSGSFTFGALLLGNSTLGFHQIFSPTATNGLGSSAPPTNFAINNVSLASIFGTGITTGTVLEFRIADINTADNIGTFSVSGSLDSSATAIPEPFTIIGTLIGGAAAIRMRKKLKQTAK